ncbi:MULTISPECIES: FAD-dependent oxidoreductase [unclassified Haladaptatus]|uniref:NAD(P)/FAD-dependent oxidoreductase n=1 Tax=unclassified Haladaptatus TaxID=2622732 RepID=UPI00209C50C0|nr:MULTISPECIES: FAD-dependent oxidoreductase [unclassified Haladaptatus]MCO8246233.1 FAD-binding oxidoreductase [Haladaptatus sp. AB643]MCO8254146.1 FAD-binding oxidoreductase [Haladaptatus sp. AB618]
MKVGIVGGGAVGLTAAHDLAARGADVTLFEAGEIPNEGESTSRAAGVLYDAFAAPEDARIGSRAIERFREFSGTGGFEFVETPYVWFARTGDEKPAAAIREQVPRMREQGRDVAFIHASELKERFPTVNVEDVGVAAIARNTGCTDPGSYAGMMAAEAETEGAEIRTETPVRVRLGDEGSDDPRIVPLVDGDASGESFDAIVVAAGSHTKRVFAEVGIPVALKPYRVQALTCEFDADTPMLYDATEGYYLRPHPEGLLAGDGTEDVESDPTDWKHESDDAFVAAMEERLSHRLDFGSDTELESASEPTVERAWAGLCTATPDYDPLLGEFRPNCYVAAGWQGHGFMRSPALGEAIAKDVLGEGGIPEFDPTRFAGDEEFEIVEGMAVE